MAVACSDRVRRDLSRRHRSRRGAGRRAGRSPAFEGLEARSLLTGTWTPLVHTAPSPDGIGTMMLLSDGTVMAQGGGVDKTWYRLTPDSAGSYVNGTWTLLASMSLQRLYFGSNVLQDGRVLVVGGEYSGPSGAQNLTNTGEIYDSVTNSWTSIPNFPQSRFGDDPTEVLPDGTVLAGYVSGPQTYIYNPATDAWTQTGTKLRNDQSDEEAWVKLPDDSILSYDIFASISSGVGHAQRYIPSTGQWVDAGTVPVQLSSSAVGFELGPGFLLPDGRVFYLGANGNTAYYTPSTNSWTAGPVIPNGLGADDAPGAELPNGKILFAADTPLFNGPTRLFEFDPTTNTYTDVTPPSSVISTSGPSYVERMLVLPTGQVLLTTGGSRLAVYTPDGSPDPSLQPTISGVTANSDGSFTLTGTQLNGVSEGAAYGDDAEMSSNYPLVQLTDAAGNVTYARTFNWSSTGVATGDTPVSTEFQLPRGLNPGGLYALSVVANGIASAPVPFMVGQGGPYVTSFSPSGSILPAPQVDLLQVTFDRPIDVSTFTTASIDGFTGPGGADLSGLVTGVDVVPGSDDRQFVITLAQPLTTTGAYSITIGPDIFDTNGNPMDQNGNYMPGEVPGDEFTTSFSVLGPRIIASTPSGSQAPGVADITVTFNEPMDPSSFDPSEVALVGPNGPIAVNDVTPVAGSNDTQFDIMFDPQTVVGSYRAVIGPDIRDPFGNEMDQNNNGITGEVPGDQFVATFSVFGPRIIASTPTGTTEAPVTDITVTFNEPMDPSSFDPNQVVLTGPNGPIAVNDVTPVAGSNNTRFDIAFDPQSSLGSYRAVIGPDIRDPFGNEMDQNNNGIAGEVPGDQFIATFSIIQIVNYQAQAVPQSFIQLAGDPNAFTIITSADDSSVAVNLGSNTFTFYNGTYTGNSQLFASSNGLITFGSANSAFSNTNLTNNNPAQAAIAPLWSDWIGSNVNNASNPMVLGKFTTFNGAPALVVEWNQIWHFTSSPQTISFEAILMLNTGTTQGDIYFEYANLDTGDLNANGATATVGIKESGSQPLTGGNLLLVNFNNGTNPLVQSNTAIHLSVASAGPDVEAQFDDPFAVPLVPPVKPVLTDGNQGDDGRGGGNGGDVGIGAPPVGPSVAVAPRVPGGWDQGATTADVARGTLIDLAIADGDPDAPGLSLAGLTRPGRRRSTWLTS